MSILDPPKARPITVADNPVAFAFSSLDTPRLNFTGKALRIYIRCGVISLPGQNSHLYLEHSADGSTNWEPMGGYTGVRNNIRLPGAGEVAFGTTLDMLVPPGHWWRLRTLTIAGWDPATFVLESTTSYFMYEENAA